MKARFPNSGLPSEEEGIDLTEFHSTSPPKYTTHAESTSTLPAAIDVADIPDFWQQPNNYLPTDNVPYGTPSLPWWKRGFQIAWWHYLALWTSLLLLLCFLLVVGILAIHPLAAAPEAPNNLTFSPNITFDMPQKGSVGGWYELPQPSTVLTISIDSTATSTSTIKMCHSTKSLTQESSQVTATVTHSTATSTSLDPTTSSPVPQAPSSDVETHNTATTTTTSSSQQLVPFASTRWIIPPSPMPLNPLANRPG
jgi:hypothetical protein